MQVGTGALASLPDKLDELLKEEYKLKTSVKREVESLSKELRSTHAKLCKVTEVRWDYLDEKLRIWANNARKLSYDMEKNVDNILLRMGGNEFTKKMPNLGMKDKTSIQIADAIKDIRYRVQKLGDQVEDAAAKPAALTIDPVCEDQTDNIGMEEATDNLIKLACDGDQQLKILSIVGLGGLGKTSLATAVYDGIKIKIPFDCMAFIPVGQSPEIKMIFKTMLYQLDKYKYMTIHEASWDKRQLIYELRKFLQNKRYLIVIDDLRDRIFWDFISSSLPSNNNGSRVITTTRVNNIAESCSSHEDLIYEIKPLGYQNSKRLFQKRCFGSEDNCHHALTEVDEILKMCSGMPLGIISIASEIASLLNRKVKEPFQEMMKLLHSARADSRSMGELTNILSYRYFDLPSTLRACLLYLAASAKNQRIQKDNLVKKWIAEGLIPEDEDFSREKVASRYLDDLVNRNVIQPVQYSNCNYEINFMMLYALRVMAQEENFATILSGFDTSEAYVDVMPIRLFIQCSDSERSIITERMNLNKVHSLTMLGTAKLVLFKHLEHVQVLDLDGCEDLDNSAMHDICRMIQLKYLSLTKTRVTEIPPQIGKLRYLKILAIRNTPITTLPPQIGELLNLETLDVRQTRVKELPKEVIQLPKLAHLHFGQSGSLGVKLPVGSDQLKSVKVMGTVDSRECSESAMEISEMAEVRELAVVLYDGPADEKRNYKLLSSIGKCKKLQSLTIYGDSDPSDKLLPASAVASPNFPSLNKLKVAGRFVKVPGWIAQLSVLNKLDIRVCKLEPDHLGILGGLPCLSSLALALVAGLPRRRVVITSSAGFQSLEDFNFDCHVPWLTFQEGAMPMLKHLDLMLYSCPADKSPSGIIRLQSLKKVILRYSSQYAGSDGVTETVAVMREEADSHANLIVLSINGDKEIFPSSTSVDSRVTGAEIEEC